MTPDPDLTPYLHGLAPDPAAAQSARTFAARFHVMPLQNVEGFVMCFAAFHNDHARPGLPAGLSEAVAALAFAASGLFAFVEDAHRAGDTLDTARLREWGTLTRARLWAVDTLAGAAAPLTPDEAAAGGYAATRPHLLPAWAEDMRRAGRVREAAHFATWYTVAHLLEAAPTLEDGEAEGYTAALLSAFAPAGGPGFDLPALTLSPSRPQAVVGASPDDLPFPDPDPTVSRGPHVPQDVAALDGGRVIFDMGGGEAYTVGRSDVTLIPLDGLAFVTLYPGTPDAATLRLSPDQARTVARALGLEGEDPHRLN